MHTRISRKEMLPLIGMTIAAFLVNTSEFMPIGLLTDIATEFQITEARAGFMITIYSWVVMILSLPLMLLACTCSIFSWQRDIIQLTAILNHS